MQACKPTSSLLVAVYDHAVVVKINGRANFTTSVTFKHLMQKLQGQGFENFVLDLSECATMDSTFLGILAATALKLSTTGTIGDQPPHRLLRLLNTNQRIAELLDNLGVADLFRPIECANVPQATLEPTNEPAPSRAEVSRTCLEAHQLLMDLNPENVARFKDVTQFLAEDLRKMDGEQTAKDPADKLQGAPTS